MNKTYFLPIATMRTQVLASLLLAAASTVSATVAFPRSTLNGPCTGKDGAPGVCVPTKSCTRDNGTYIDNACPGTPDDVKCCTKPHCQLEARSGDCRWKQNCNGNSLVQYLCPGPDSFQCCITNEGTGTTQPTAAPKPTTTTENLGEKILAKAKEAEGIPCMS